MQIWRHMLFWAQGLSPALLNFVMNIYFANITKPTEASGGVDWRSPLQFYLFLIYMSDFWTLTRNIASMQCCYFDTCSELLHKEPVQWQSSLRKCRVWNDLAASDNACTTTLLSVPQLIPIFFFFEPWHYKCVHITVSNFLASQWLRANEIKFSVIWVMLVFFLRLIALLL